MAEDDTRSSYDEETDQQSQGWDVESQAADQRFDDVTPATGLPLSDATSDPEPPVDPLAAKQSSGDAADDATAAEPDPSLEPPTAVVAPQEAERLADQSRHRKATAELGRTAGAETTSRPLHLDPLALESPPGEGQVSWITDHALLQAETQRLARLGNWRQLAAVTGHALLAAPYASGATRTAMLIDLARLYRDRLQDEERTEQAFALLAQDSPSNTEALDYLCPIYEHRQQWESIFDLYLAAVEATWAPNDRLVWTREAAQIAIERMDRLDLAIRAWEQLWRLEEGIEEAASALSRYYRAAGRWVDMAGFLRRQASRLQGAAKLLALRELAEVLLSGEHAAQARDVLEMIVDVSPGDPVATLQLARVYAQIKDWDALQRLGLQAAEEQAVDLQHLIADALWHAGRHQQAVEAYDRMLAVDPANAEAVERKRQFLLDSERYRELLDLLVEQADNTDDDAQRAAVLQQAAELAEHNVGEAQEAISLWEAKTAIDSTDLQGYQALCRLYERVGDLQGVARSLERQLPLVKESAARLELLRRLGQHYASRLGDDDRAEERWKEILALDPSDLPAREDLIELHRRRGDFESLHSALQRQITLTADDERAEALCRLAAENLDQNFDAPERSVEAWQRVLDFAPRDLQALQALAKHYRTLQQRGPLITVLEEQIIACDEPQARVELALQVAQLWEQAEKPWTAAAAYERVLRWDPLHVAARQALLRLYRNGGQLEQAFRLLDHIATFRERPQRIELLREGIGLLEAEAHAQRFALLRRILLLSEDDPAVLQELQQEAQAAKLWPEMLAVLTHLASQQVLPGERLRLQQLQAEILSKQLDDTKRAHVTLQATLLSPERHERVLDELTRLTELTGRWEELLAVLDTLTTPEFDLKQRKRLFEQRARICEECLADPLRSFFEHRRRLELDATDWSALDDLLQLCRRHGDADGLWQRLDALYAELWDRTEQPELRLDLLDRRVDVARRHLKDPAKVFEAQLGSFRLDFLEDKRRQDLLQSAESLDCWHRLLPVWEAVQLALPDGATDASVAQTALLYEEKVNDPRRGFALCGELLVADPSQRAVFERLEQLAQANALYAELADVLRRAAARAEEKALRLLLLRRIAGVYEDELGTPERAIDLHRRLLELKADEMRSLEVVLDWHRRSGHWRDLRDRLRQWLSLAPAGGDTTSKLMEIARVSEQHLDDPEAALQAYGQVLEVQPDHEKAQRGLQGLIEAVSEPSLRLRWLRMQLQSAEGKTAVDLQLEIAQIEQQDLGQVDNAIHTLEQLVDQDGATGLGFAPLSGLLRQQERYRELVELLAKRAEQLHDPRAQLAALDEAIAVCHERLPGQAAELRERLYVHVLSLRPDDRPVRVRLARLLRRSQRYEELVSLLEQQIAHAADAADREAALFEQARIYARNLDRVEQARACYECILQEDPQHEGALLALAALAREVTDWPRYIELRRQQAEQRPPHEAALILCHLAELCDEQPPLAEQLVPLYREARALDPHNTPAMEALKGIGRRLKTLRPSAALLPFDGERELSWPERAIRLRALAEQTMASDRVAALDWLYRAVAVDPDNAEHWSVFASALRQQPHAMADVFRAQHNSLHALQRTEALSAARLGDEAERLYQLAVVARAAEYTDRYETLVQQAFELVPGFAPAALATAESRLARDDLAGAHELLHEVLEQHQDELDSAQRAEALYSRGVVLRRLGQLDRALEDFREVLRLNALHAPSLEQLGGLLAQQKRYAGALEYQMRALTVSEDPQERARLFFQLGLLLEDGLRRYEEAGACYETALAEGFEERELYHRALRHYQRAGRLDESLQVVEGLLPDATDSDELATLWLVRGEVLAAEQDKQEQAIEAFDMALSYDPGRTEAREGLTRVLERRGDWNQVLQVLEASSDSGTPEQQADALRKIADICRERMRDLDRAEEYLRRAVNLVPSAAALEHLYQIYREHPEREAEQRDVLGLLVAFGPPWFSRVWELGKSLLEVDTAWAWCLLSPLLGVSQIDSESKSLLQSMRKEYERPGLLSPYTDSYPLLLHPSAHREVAHVLAELLECNPELGVTSVEQASEGGAIAIGPHTGLGRKFGALAEGAGIADCLLFRTQSVPENIKVINEGGAPRVVVRTEVLQQLVHAEVGFLFGYALELAQPEHRLMASMLPEHRPHLLPALYHVLGWRERAGHRARFIAERICAVMDDARRERWKEMLEPLREQDPSALGGTWWAAVCIMARRAGLLAGPDLRQAFRVVARIDDDVPRPRVVAHLAELDEYVAQSAALQDLVAFAASPAFGQLMQGANPVAVS